MLHIFHTVIILYIFNFVYLADLVYSNLLHSAHLFKTCGMYVQILFLDYIINPISIIKNLILYPFDFKSKLYLTCTLTVT